MSCSTCNTCKQSTALCGCEDKGLTTGPSCAQGTPACPNPEPCAETFSDCCIIHNGASIISPENDLFPILNGERLCDILQKLVIYLNSPTCLSSSCPPPVGLLIKGSTSTTITIGWTPSAGALQYVASYWNPATSAFVDSAPFTATTTPQYTFTGLTANTTYYFRVTPTCASTPVPPCSSVVIQAKTKPA